MGTGLISAPHVTGPKGKQQKNKKIEVALAHHSLFGDSESFSTSWTLGHLTYTLIFFWTCSDGLKTTSSDSPARSGFTRRELAGRADQT